MAQISFLKDIDYYSVKLYLTESCNLNCEYCYFRNRSGDSIDVSKLKPFLAKLPLSRIGFFVVTGGEPLLEWDKTREIIDFMRQDLNFEGEIILQTNGTLFSKDKLDFIRENNLSCELGLDGDYETTARYRSGINPESYRHILDSITLLDKQGTKYYISMTLYSDKCDNICHNFFSLSEKGIKNIDLCPVVFETWKPEQAKSANKQLLKLFGSIDRTEDGAISREFDSKVGKKKILIIMPSGDISLNYFCMSVPRDKRESYYFANISNPEKINTAILENSIKVYKDIENTESATYKDILVKFAQLSYNDCKDDMGDIGIENWTSVMNYKEKIEKLYSRIIRNKERSEKHTK